MTTFAAAVIAALVVIAAGRAPAMVRIGHWTPTSPDPPRTAMWAVAGLVGALLVTGVVSPVVVGGAAGLVLVAKAVVGRRRRRAAADQRSAAVVEVTYGLAAELRAGRTPAEALHAVAEVAGPLSQELHAASGAVAVGADPAAELAAASQQPGASRLRPVAAAWQVAVSAGGQVAVVLERLAEAMDAEDELQQELSAALAGPTSTMFLLAGLPLVGLSLGTSIGAHPIQLLLHRPIGWGLLAAAGLLELIGVVAMRAIVSRAQSA